MYLLNLTHSFYKKQKLKELKQGGKQYAEALGDTDEIKGLLPWPRMLYSTDKLIGYSHNNLTDVNICMPCGNWAHLENVKAVNRKRIKYWTSEEADKLISPMMFFTLSISKPGDRIPMFNFAQYLKSPNIVKEDMDRYKKENPD